MLILTQKQSDRFWSRVDIDDGGCWLWRHRLHKSGYGSIALTSGGVKRLFGAHVVAYAIHADVPPGLCVLHSCDVRRCVRPDHLFIGTRADNVRDMDEKHRRVVLRGERHGRAKLTTADVAVIRSDTSSSRACGRRFGVHQSTILAIRNGESWRANVS